MQFLMHDHPDRTGDTDFIRYRGRQAAAVFADASRQGMPVEDCIRLAGEVLYRGLHFSPFRMITDILDTDDRCLPLSDEGRHSLGMALLAHCRPLIESYLTPDSRDTFEGSYAFHKVRREVRQMINLYLTDHGL